MENRSTKEEICGGIYLHENTKEIQSFQKHTTPHSITCTLLSSKILYLLLPLIVAYIMTFYFTLWCFFPQCLFLWKPRSILTRMDYTLPDRFSEHTVKAADWLNWITMGLIRMWIRWPIHVRNPSFSYGFLLCIFYKIPSVQIHSLGQIHTVWTYVLCCRDPTYAHSISKWCLG